MVGATELDVAVPARFTIAVGVCGSLLVIVIVPESFPAIVGVNDTFRFALPPGGIVLGVVIPETPKGVPVKEIKEMTRFAHPALLTTRG
jgi:hypothetical protein